MELAILISLLNSGLESERPRYTTLVKGLNLQTRFTNLINAFVEDGLTESVHSFHPNVSKFLELWKDYIQLPTENLDQYETMKKSFINAFGEKWFNEYLFYSYYFVRTQTMNERKYEDSNLRPVGE